MFDLSEKSQTNKTETIQDIAYKLTEEQLRLVQGENGGFKERTIFILGSKGVGKSTIINKFFERDENPKPTLALEYSYGRRSGAGAGQQKQVLNIWELGGLENTEQLIEVPMKTHGVDNFSAIIIVDLSQPQRLWLDLEQALRGLKQSYENLLKDANEREKLEEKAKERLKKDVKDMDTLDLLPFPVVIVGGKYDLFLNMDASLKKPISQCLRSLAHLTGSSLLYYSSKIQKLSKTLRDTVSRLGFGTPSNPFRSHCTDYNDALSIWFGNDAWDKISEQGNAFSMNDIHRNLCLDVPQLDKSKDKPLEVVDPAKDQQFRESIIDEMRAQKDEELQAIVKDLKLRGKFETVTF